MSGRLRLRSQPRVISGSAIRPGGPIHRQGRKWNEGGQPAREAILLHEKPLRQTGDRRSVQGREADEHRHGEPQRIEHREVDAAGVDKRGASDRASKQGHDDPAESLGKPRPDGEVEEAP